MSEGAEEVLHRLISASGDWSRRKAQDLILDGRVKVDGQLVIDKAARVSPQSDIRVDGKRIRAAKVDYLILNKPTGYVTTMADPHARQTVADLIRDTGAKVKPVGRLDKDTEGLLILTNDGDLAFRLTHPRYGIEKEYEVEVAGDLTEAAILKLEKGIRVEGRLTAPAAVPRETVRLRDSRTAFRIILHEGRKRQVREMCLAVGHPVKKLRRVRIGPLVMRNLPKGACRRLSKPEVDALKREVGLLKPDKPRHMPTEP